MYSNHCRLGETVVNLYFKSGQPRVEDVSVLCPCVDSQMHANRFLLFIVRAELGQTGNNCLLFPPLVVSLVSMGGHLDAFKQYSSSSAIPQ